jgi:hypothetical protein
MSSDEYQLGEPMSFTINAPLMLVLDNFTEAEHAAMVHSKFGSDLQRMNEAIFFVNKLKDNDNIECGVHSTFYAPMRPMPFWMRWLLWVKNDWYFMDRWETNFWDDGSVTSCFWHSWRKDKEIGHMQVSAIRWRVHIEFVPIGLNRTYLTVVGYLKSDWNWLLDRCFRWLTIPIVRRFLRKEIEADKAIIESLASKETSLAGCHLSRFDKQLGINREMYARMNHVHSEMSGV